MKHLRFSLLSLLLFVGTFCHAYEFIYGDDTRTGTLFAKDPIIVFHGGRYLMYYSIPPHNSRDWEGWNIGIAESPDLRRWQRIGEITPQADYEAKGLCAPGAIVRGDTIHLFYQTYGGFNDNSEMADMADDWGCVAWPVLQALGTAGEPSMPRSSPTEASTSSISPHATRNSSGSCLAWQRHPLARTSAAATGRWLSTLPSCSPNCLGKASAARALR